MKSFTQLLVEAEEVSSAETQEVQKVDALKTPQKIDTPKAPQFGDIPSQKPFKQLSDLKSSGKIKSNVYDTLHKKLTNARAPQLKQTSEKPRDRRRDFGDNLPDFKNYGDMYDLVGGNFKGEEISELLQGMPSEELDDYHQFSNFFGDDDLYDKVSSMMGRNALKHLGWDNLYDMFEDGEVDKHFAEISKDGFPGEMWEDSLPNDEVLLPSSREQHNKDLNFEQIIENSGGSVSETLKNLFGYYNDLFDIADGDDVGVDGGVDGKYTQYSLDGDHGNPGGGLIRWTDGLRAAIQNNILKLPQKYQDAGITPENFAMGRSHIEWGINEEDDAITERVKEYEEKYGKKAPDGFAEKMQALDALYTWRNKVAPSIDTGTILTNNPSRGGRGNNARARIYQKMGFLGGQDGIMGINNRVIPFNERDFDYRSPTSGR